VVGAYDGLVNDGLTTIWKEAGKLGANAIVDVRWVASGGKFFVYGTAVVVEPEV
jgi:uncharacterized protein YbjQ (UPF0145 family)